MEKKIFFHYILFSDASYSIVIVIEKHHTLIIAPRPSLYHVYVTLENQLTPPPPASRSNT